MRKFFLEQPYVRAVLGIAVDMLMNKAWTSPGLALHHRGEGLAKLAKMILGPISVCTMAFGIVSMKNLGRFGGKALIYFEIVPTIALVVGACAFERGFPSPAPASDD